jgi:hypothetical protein
MKRNRITCWLWGMGVFVMLLKLMGMLDPVLAPWIVWCAVGILGAGGWLAYRPRRPKTPSFPHVMLAEPDNSCQPTADEGEKQLCVSCRAPNEPSAHFCIKCGAPLSSYASTGPFESLFAEGAVYRQAAEQPRSFIVVFGVWLIFGIAGLAGLVMVVMGRDTGIGYATFGAFMLVISVMLMWKSTRNYLNRPKAVDRHDR